MAYDRQKRSFEELPPEADRYGRQTKGGGKGKGKGKKSAKTESESPAEDTNNNSEGAYPWIKKPLACLDVFAGCGGLSLGLHQVKS